MILECKNVSKKYGETKALDELNLEIQSGKIVGLLGPIIMVMSRKAKLYLLDEPMGGVDPAARDYILKTIISNYSENATVIISTHLIQDVEQILDEVVFLKEGRVMLHKDVDELREEKQKSVDALFREVFSC